LMDRGTRWGLGGESCLAGEIVDGVAVGAVDGAQWCGDGRGLAGELAESGRRNRACRRVRNRAWRSLWGSITGSGLDSLAGWDHP
jgi:hypothetical protein